VSSSRGGLLPPCVLLLGLLTPCFSAVDREQVLEFQRNPTSGRLTFLAVSNTPLTHSSTGDQVGALTMTVPFNLKSWFVVVHVRRASSRACLWRRSAPTTTS
jgi:hypothetical protein